MALIVVTGASSGIGEATARRLAREPGVELLLVARREHRLETLASELDVPAATLALDLTDDDAPARVAERVQRHGARLQGLVNNAGASWRGTFADTGYATVRRTMDVNFDAPVRLTEALLPALRDGAPSVIANVASTAARVSRPGTGGYSASKAALAAWSDSLAAEEHANGVMVGLVLPGFVATEGFPARELTSNPLLRWVVGDVDDAAEAVVDVVLGRRVERFVPRPYALTAALRLMAPGLLRRVQRSAAGRLLTTRTAADDEDARVAAPHRDAH